MIKHKIPVAAAPAPQEVIQVEIDGYPAIALYNLDGEYFATADTCTHGEASLAEGDIEHGEIICPFHMGAFDIRTGEATVPPCATAVRVYPVSAADGIVTIEIEP